MGQLGKNMGALVVSHRSRTSPIRGLLNEVDISGRIRRVVPPQNARQIKNGGILGFGWWVVFPSCWWLFSTPLKKMLVKLDHFSNFWMIIQKTI